MNTDQKLRRLLTDAADSYDPPSLVRSRSHVWNGDFWRQRTVRIVSGVAVACLLLVALGFGIANVHRGSSSTSSSTSSSSGSKSAAVSAGGTSEEQTVNSGGVGEPLAAAPAAAAASPAPQAAAGSVATAGSSVPGQASRVVQTGQLSLEVARGQVSPILARLGTIADAAGGYVSQSKDDDTDALASGTSTLRVPVASFDSVTAQARKLGHVTSASSQATDVTSQYVDLSARITALQESRDQFLTLETKATTIGDTLSVMSQIQNVQTQLEQLQGQQKVLADSSDLATLSVGVIQKGAAAARAPKPKSSNGFGKALRRTGHAFNTGLQAVIAALGPILLGVIILGILVGFGLLGRRVYRAAHRQ